MRAFHALPKPIPVSAVKFEGGFTNYNEISKWIQSQPSSPPDYGAFSIWYGGFGEAGRFMLALRQGELEVPPGSYIIRSVSNEYAIVTEAQFNRIYQRQYNFAGE